MNMKSYSNRVVHLIKILKKYHKLTLKLLRRQFLFSDNRTEVLEVKNFLFFAILNSQLFTSGNMSTKILNVR